MLKSLKEIYLKTTLPTCTIREDASPTAAPDTWWWSGWTKEDEAWEFPASNFILKDVFITGYTHLQPRSVNGIKFNSDFHFIVSTHNNQYTKEFSETKGGGVKSSFHQMPDEYSKQFHLSNWNFEDARDKRIADIKKACISQSKISFQGCILYNYIPEDIKKTLSKKRIEYIENGFFRGFDRSQRCATVVLYD